MPPTPHCGDQSHQTSWSIVLLFELFTTCVEFQLCCLVPKTTSGDSASRGGCTLQTCIQMEKASLKDLLLPIRELEIGP